MKNEWLIITGTYDKGNTTFHVRYKGSIKKGFKRFKKEYPTAMDIDAADIIIEADNVEEGIYHPIWTGFSFDDAQGNEQSAIYAGEYPEALIKFEQNHPGCEVFDAAEFYTEHNEKEGII